MLPLPISARPISLLLAVCLSSAAAAAPLLVIGDSLTKEYEISFPGVPLASVPGIDPDNPSARNWVEILNARPGGQFDPGEYRTSLAAPWKDLRLLGHEYNWAVPGAKARQIRDLLLMRNLDEITNDAGFKKFTDLAAEWQQSGTRITAQLQSGAGGVVIWVGANDLRSGSTDPAAAVNGTPVTYGSIYNGDGTGAGNPQPLMDSIRASIQEIANYVRAGNATIPLAICAVPHIGSTPDVMSTFPTDATRTGRVTTALEALNAELKTWTESTAKGVWVPETYTITKDLIATPLNIGGITFKSEADPLGAGDSAAAHNHYLFAVDGFHPTTALQALVSKAVSSGLKTAFPAAYEAVQPLETREILTVLGLSPATGFTEFLTAAGVPADSRGALDDPDHDGLPNITEYALAGFSPSAADTTAMTSAVLDTTGPVPVVRATWTPRFADNAACAITCQASIDLSTWVDVREAEIVTGPTGQRSAQVPVAAGAKAFLRLKITATP
ncbi:MAG: SGNH/GDSL hydrolase family protein [Verrucomicrobiota bacterium]